MKMSLAAAPSRLPPFFQSRRGIILGLGLIACIALWGVFGVLPGLLVHASAPAELPRSPRTIVVGEAPITSSVEVVGTIGPGGEKVVVAPFDGYVAEVRAETSKPVSEGDVLLRMDTEDVEGRLRDAEASLLKAAMAAEAIRDWKDGPEAARARRATMVAETALTNLEQQQRESKVLFDKGIISRSELQGLQQQVDNQRDQLASARQDLSAILDHKNIDNQRLADLGLESARAQAAMAAREMEAAVIRARQSGTLMKARVASSDGRPTPAVEPGAHVTRGQVLFTIADPKALVVDAVVDEIDVGKIQDGQEVDIEGDAFPSLRLKGRIVSVSADVVPADAGSHNGHYAVKVAFGAPSAGPGASSLRMGMSARLRIQTYDNPHAIVIPPDAVRQAASGTVVTRRLPSGKVEDVPVSLGAATAAEVEVLSGLRRGDAIEVPEAR